MTKLRFISFSVVCAALLVSTIFSGPAAIKAQTAASAARITSRIDETQLVTLTGNTHPAAIAANDRGPVSPDLPFADLTLVLSRAPQQQSAFDAFVASQYDHSSPNFHQWLTPAQIGTRFGPAQSDIDAVSTWLTSHGFAIAQVSPDRMTIDFSGTASQVESAFHTQIHALSVDGVAHIANMTDPQVPAAIAPVVLGIKGLHNFLPHPLHKIGSAVQFDTQSGKWQRVDATNADSIAGGAKSLTEIAGRLTPQFGIGTPASSSNFAYLEEDIAPADFATIYNVQPLYNSSITGSGQTIAIAGTSDICLGQSAAPCSGANDVTAFRTAFGLPTTGPAPIQIVANGIDPGVCTSSTNACSNGDLLENSLDVEWSGAVATGAQVVLVTSGYNNQSTPTNDAIYQDAQYVIQNHGNSSFPQVSAASILSLSYGECELFNGTASNVAYNNLWQTAAGVGISVFVASGDSGAPACDQGFDANGNPWSAQYGRAVNGLGSTPYNTAVGGTDFSWCKPVYNSNGTAINGCPNSTSSPGPYWNTSNNTTTGESAAGYVPETPWNDTCLNPIWAAYIESIAPLFSLSTPANPEAACNFIQNEWPTMNSDNVSAGGGQFVIAYFVDTVGGGGGASNCVTNSSGTSIGACSAGTTASTGATTNPTTGATQSSLTLYNNGWPKPIWQSGVIGIPSDGVRDLPDVSFFSGDGALNSATLVCASLFTGATCAATSTSNSSSTNMLEVGGTSVATPQMAGVMALINQKIGTSQGLAAPGLYKLGANQTYANCSAEGPPSANCNFHSIDQGTNAMPCDLGASEGGAVFESGFWHFSTPSAGINSPNCAALNSGDTVGTLVSSGTTPGYNAAAGFNLATGLGSLNVANVVNNWVSDAGTGSTTMTVSPVPSTITINQAMTVTVSVVGAGTPTNTITLSGDGYSATETIGTSPCTSNLVCVFTIPANTLAPGSSIVLTAYYNGDSNFAANSKTATITVNQMAPTVTVSASNGNVANPLPVTVTVAGPTGSVAIPSGTVSLSGGGYSVGGVALSGGIATINIPANSLIAVNDALTVTYGGDANYTGGSIIKTVIMTSGPTITPTVTVTPSPTSPQYSGETLSVAVKVTGSGATPTGSVTLTGGTYTSSATALVSGNASFTIPANALPVATDTITATYTGDSTYLSGNGTSSVSVTQSTFTLGSNPTPSPSTVAPGSSATVSITGTNSSNFYNGTVTFGSNSCVVTTSSITSPNDPPTCSITGSITYANGTASGSATATISTTASVTTELVRPKRGNGKDWLGAGSGVVLAFLVFLGVPARRKSWRAMFGLLVLTAVLSVLSACGGSSGGGSTTIPGTSAGTYTFTATGTGSPAISPAPTTTFTVTVN